MPSIRFLVPRDNAQSSGMDPTLRKLLIALIVLGFCALILVASLHAARQVRRRRRCLHRLTSTSELPMYECHRRSMRNSSRLTVATAASAKRESAFVAHEKELFLAASDSPPGSPIPEIRITFPEEVDDRGKRQSGRVVVVRVGEHSIGLEPVREDLPAYQADGGRFQSLDLDRIGGLKEKEVR